MKAPKQQWTEDQLDGGKCTECNSPSWVEPERGWWCTNPSCNMRKKAADKKKKHESRMECFECQDGHYDEVLKEYNTEDSTGKQYTLQNIAHLICDKCGTCCFSGRVSTEISKQLEAQGFPFRRRKLLTKAKQQP